MNPMTNEEKIAILNQTKGQLYTRGWTQGASINNRGEVCLMGALREALSEEGNWWTDAYKEKGRTIRDLMSKCAGTYVEGEGGHIAKWNDCKERTFGDVVELIDDTIVKVKEGNQ